MNTHHRYLALVALMVAMLILTACPPHVSIADINRNPGRYAGKEVTIAGRVSGSMGALGTGVFEIDDGTGKMWVYSQGFGVPASGAKVGVSGTIQQGFSLGGRSFATILRQTRRTR